MNLVKISVDYFPSPTRGVPVFSGSIYVGNVNTDPEIAGNQKQVSVLQEDTTLVPIAQPVLTSAGGVPIYNGSPVSIYVEGEYSLKVLDSLGAQVYYVPSTMAGVSAIPLSGSAIDWAALTDQYQSGYPVPYNVLTAVTPEQFGAVGDEVTDDWQALTDCFTHAAGTNQRAVLLSVYGTTKPVLIPDGLNVSGPVNSSNELHTPVKIKAIAPFVSTYTMDYWDLDGAGSSETYEVAAVLISKAWADGEDIGQPCNLDNFMVDADDLKDTRGAVLHGYLAYNQFNYCGIDIFNTTGFGVWHNSQKVNGEESYNLVDCEWNKMQVRDAGSGDDTYEINGNTYRYDAFHFGPLEDSATTAAGNAKISGQITDGRITDCSVTKSSGPLRSCSGHGIRCIDGSGWLITGNHTNATGMDGISCKANLTTVISNNILDGFGADAPANSGALAAISLKSILGRVGGAGSSGPVVSNNTIRYREPAEKTGNTFHFLQAAGSGLEGAMCLITDNMLQVKSDVLSPVDSILAVSSAASGFTCTVRNNVIDKEAYLKIFSANSTSVVHDHQGNSWQNVSMTGLAITNAADNGSGLVRITSVGHGLITDDRVYVTGIVGTTEGDGVWKITVIDDNTFDLIGTVFTNPYTSGGWISEKPKRGWHPLGYEYKIVDRTKTDPSGYLCIISSDPGTFGVFGSSSNGSTADRPLLDQIDAGFVYYDSTLSLLIVWNSVRWRAYNTNMINV